MNYDKSKPILSTATSPLIMFMLV